MLQEYIYWVLLSLFSYAYHMRLIVQQTSILLKLRHVQQPYPGQFHHPCFMSFPRGKQCYILTLDYQCLTADCLQYVITVYQYKCRYTILWTRCSSSLLHFVLQGFMLKEYSSPLKSYFSSIHYNFLFVNNLLFKKNLY